MERTIHSHDPVTGKADITFVHNGVTVRNEYNLKLVIPGSLGIFEEMGIDFTDEFQMKALDRLTASIQTQIESGTLTNGPEPLYTPPVPSE